MRLRLWDETAVNDSTSTAGGRAGGRIYLSFVGRERRKGGAGKREGKRKEGKGRVDRWMEIILFS